MTSWADDEGAVEFVKGLKRMRKQQEELILGNCRGRKLYDPEVREALSAAIGALEAYERVIIMMEDERGKSDD